MFADPQVIARKMRIDLPDASVKGGSIPGVRAPITMLGTPLHYDKPSPRHGENSEEVRAAIEAGKPAFRPTRER